MSLCVRALTPSFCFGQSNLGLIVAVAVIVASGLVFGWQKVVFFYGVPYLVVNAYLVLITYLQHTATYIPHYRAEEFTWLRGALSTVDRTFGWPIDGVLHRITDTHVVHHLFHTMPFYHAEVRTGAGHPGVVRVGILCLQGCEQRGCACALCCLMQEATKAVRPLLGAYYLRDDTPVFQALWHSWTQCKFVDDCGAYLHFKAK